MTDDADDRRQTMKVSRRFRRAMVESMQQSVKMPALQRPMPLPPPPPVGLPNPSSQTHELGVPPEIATRASDDLFWARSDEANLMHRSERVVVTLAWAIVVGAALVALAIICAAAMLR